MSFKVIDDLRYYDNLPYRIKAEESEYTDGSKCYRAFHPELPGCSSHGETPQEALKDLNDARKCYLETLLETGQKIPLPKLPTTQQGTGNSAIPSTSSYIMVPEIGFGKDASHQNQPPGILQEIDSR